MAQTAIAERVFTSADQEQFAALSGDYNPMHMDAGAARRTIAGRPVVHGIHTILWGLDSLYRQIPDLPPLRSVTVRFDKAIHLGDRVSTVWIDDKRLNVIVEGIIVTHLNLTFGARQTATVPPSAGPIFAPIQPRIDIRAGDFLLWADISSSCRVCSTHISICGIDTGCRTNRMVGAFVIPDRHGVPWPPFALWRLRPDGNRHGSGPSRHSRFSGRGSRFTIRTGPGCGCWWWMDRIIGCLSEIGPRLSIVHACNFCPGFVRRIFGGAGACRGWIARRGRGRCQNSRCGGGTCHGDLRHWCG